MKVMVFVVMVLLLVGCANAPVEQQSAFPVLTDCALIRQATSYRDVARASDVVELIRIDGTIIGTVRLQDLARCK